MGLSSSNVQSGDLSRSLSAGGVGGRGLTGGGNLGGGWEGGGNGGGASLEREIRLLPSVDFVVAACSEMDADVDAALDRAGTGKGQEEMISLSA